MVAVETKGPKQMANEKEGDLKVWWVPQVPGKEFEVPVDSVEHGAIILSVLEEYDAFQHINNIKLDYCNDGGLQVYEGGEWCDWVDEDTYDGDPCSVYPQPSLGYCAKLTD